ncbi:glycoside hydrolase family 3 N-terminal domain-containing protein [Paracidobacterium acidisoli]|uniref:beta-N-acetylhexosaminidase n=1 Tax=Paracidobacterium acidisoli TaxID=2303751 RepID=A0A372IQX5_9BACT|nr:glycoside hydrolase family 3 N-terminal domain-containing protein [Paracidobacterium acidisoli]MBT9330151.1 hypothetical protein [Paracidobacterium acidisoli]
MNLREQVGQLIVAGVEGTSLSAADRAWMRAVRPGGVILFRRNIEAAAQVHALLRASAEAVDAAGAPLFRCIDAEGGLVDRFRDLIAPMPAPAEVFATGRTGLFKKHGRLIGAEARALGFNVAFAPVLDLALPESALVMRTRVVSADPAEVARYAGAFLDGLAAEKVLGCGKHFPGLGGGTLDSHEAMPEIHRSWEQMWEQDLAPYRALAKRLRPSARTARAPGTPVLHPSARTARAPGTPVLPFVMVAHAAYPDALNPRQKIQALGTRRSREFGASTSSFWIEGVLRRRMRFRGLVISDDMEMGGILTQASMEEAAVQAVLAGTDVIEICRDPVLVVRAWEALLGEAERSAAFRKRIHAAWHRVMAHKKQWLEERMPRHPSTAQMVRLRESVTRFAETVAKGETA